jgi:hypothetical protein
MLELNFRYTPLGKGLIERLGSPFPSSLLFNVSLANKAFLKSMRGCPRAGLHIRGPQALSIDPSRSYELMTHSSKLTLTSTVAGNLQATRSGRKIFA